MDEQIVVEVADKMIEKQGLGETADKVNALTQLMGEHSIAKFFNVDRYQICIAATCIKSEARLKVLRVAAG